MTGKFSSFPSLDGFVLEQSKTAIAGYKSQDCLNNLVAKAKQGLECALGSLDSLGFYINEPKICGLNHKQRRSLRRRSALKYIRTPTCTNNTSDKTLGFQLEYSSIHREEKRKLHALVQEQCASFSDYTLEEGFLSHMGSNDRSTLTNPYHYLSPDNFLLNREVFTHLLTTRRITKKKKISLTLETTDVNIPSLELPESSIDLVGTSSTIYTDPIVLQLIEDFQNVYEETLLNGSSLIPNEETFLDPQPDSNKSSAMRSFRKTSREETDLQSTPNNWRRFKSSSVLAKPVSSEEEFKNFSWELKEPEHSDNTIVSEKELFPSFRFNSNNWIEKWMELDSCTLLEFQYPYHRLTGKKYPVIYERNSCNAIIDRIIAALEARQRVSFGLHPKIPEATRVLRNLQREFTFSADYNRSLLLKKELVSILALRS